MITQAQDRYLEFLRCGIWGKDGPGEVDDEVVRIAVEQSTVALVLKDSAMAADKEVVMQVLFAHIVINSTIAELTDILESHGVRCVLLKGQSCAANYPVPFQRSCGDVDLFVGKEKYRQACEVLLGLECSHKVSENFSHMGFSYKGVHVEIHRVCINLKMQGRQRIIDSMAERCLSSVLPTIRLDDRDVNVLEVNFNAVYLMCHMARHFFVSGIGFRHLCDWTLFLHANKDKLDVKKLDGMLRKLRLRGTWELFGFISVRYLNLPVEEMPFYRDIPEAKADAVLEMIFRRGNFGRAEGRADLIRVDGCKSLFLRKVKAIAVYAKEFHEKRMLDPEMVPLGGLLHLYCHAFKSTLKELFGQR